jgi:predicted RNase H-like HicB family nuclease
MKQKFHVTLLTHDEGVSVSCPGLPGCHSQGATIEEATKNIRDAIHGYLELYGTPATPCEIKDLEIIVNLPFERAHSSH